MHYWKKIHSSSAEASMWTSGLSFRDFLSARRVNKAITNISKIRTVALLNYVTPFIPFYTQLHYRFIKRSPISIISTFNQLPPNH